MSNPNVPVKTPLGHQELRQRTQRLGQRYRTVLLLVDGRRSLAEILSMARQAGAQTSHFEELLRLGMLALPLPLEPPQIAEPAGLPNETPADAHDMEVRDEALPAQAADVAAASLSLPVAAPPEPFVEWTVARQEEPVADVQPSAAGAAGVPSLPATPRPPASEERLDEARRLLVDTLRRDTLLLRVFAPARVRAAQTQDELIALVWEIERQRAHAWRKRGQLLNLQRAREILGMGNTIVVEDSLPGPSPEEE